MKGLKDMFIEDMKDTMNVSMTENGALGYNTTGKKLLDINFATSSLRHKNKKEIISMFVQAYMENEELALKWLFFLRDIRGGMGERRTFRTILEYMGNNHAEEIKSLIKYIPEYGRWDDMWCLLDTPCCYTVLDIVRNQILEDSANISYGDSISLIGKWLPSEKSKNVDKRRWANIIRSYLHLDHESYRWTLSSLRKQLKIVESDMSANKWRDINYNAVPSKANINYRNAFLKHDKERRKNYLEGLKKGEGKINSSTNYPCDIVHQYSDGADWWSSSIAKYDESLEQLWKALKSCNDLDNTLVVNDGSASMQTPVSGNMTATEVARSMAIYFGERCKGEFKDKYITFSSRPQLVDFSICNSLRDKLELAKHYNDCSNTNIEAVFDLILNTAIEHNLSQDEIPHNIIVISDMEFDYAVSGYGTIDKKLFDILSDRYEAKGYKLPKLIFWNVNSRTDTIPVVENEMGVALVSGYSPMIVDMVMTGETDPYKILIDKLMSNRYAPIMI
jgi:hypothetical protein